MLLRKYDISTGKNFLDLLQDADVDPSIRTGLLTDLNTVEKGSAVDAINELHNDLLYAQVLIDDLFNTIPATFLDLTDTPPGYSGHTGKVLVVNASGTGIDFASMTGLPAGSDTQTIYYNGSTAAATNALRTNGSVVGIGQAPTANIQLSITSTLADAMKINTGSSTSRGMYINSVHPGTQALYIENSSGATAMAIGSGKSGFGTTSPAAWTHIGAGTTTVPPLRMNAGSLLSIPANGAVEFDGSHLYVTIGGLRYQLDQQAPSGSLLPAGSNTQTLYHDGTAWAATSLMRNDGGGVGIGTAPSGTYLLDVYSADNTAIRGVSVGAYGIFGRSTSNSAGFFDQLGTLTADLAQPTMRITRNVIDGGYSITAPVLHVETLATGTLLARFSASGAAVCELSVDGDMSLARDLGVTRDGSILGHLGIGSVGVADAQLSIEKGLATRTFSITLSPGDNDDLAITGHSGVRLVTSTNACRVTGIGAFSDGFYLHLFVPPGQQPVELVHNSTLSAAGNRIWSPTAGNITVRAATLFYSSPDAYWMVLHYTN